MSTTYTTRAPIGLTSSVRERTSSSSTAYHYHSIFGDVCATRFQKLAKAIFTYSWAISFAIALPSGLAWWNIILPLRAAVLAFGLFLIACLKKNNLHVDYLGYKTLANQYIGQLISKKFLITLGIYSISSYLFFWVLHLQFTSLTFKAIPKKHQYPPVNDQYVFYYFLSAYSAFIYAIQHSIFDYDRLIIPQHKFHSHPKESLIKNIPKAVSNSILLTIIVISSSPFAYLFVREYIYAFILNTVGLFHSLNHNQPALGISFGFLFKLSIISFVLLYSWEIVNIAFNAYLSIGCLHRGNTLSELSTDPLGTLLTGLKSDKQFTRMTAFQELAFIAKSEDSDRRQQIYHRNNRKEFIWGEILQECTDVINRNNSNINISLVESIKSTSIVTSNDPQPSYKSSDSQNLFGREYHSTESERKYDYLPRPTKITNELNEPLYFDGTLWKIVTSNIKNAVELSKEYYTQFVTSDIGAPFRYTLLRESKRLSPNAITVSNAIIAISLMATHAYDEDKKGTVSSTITEILDILEKSVATCGEFAQNPPAYLTGKDDENPITLLHQLSLNAFVEVTLKYSDVLNDIVLPPDVFRLANWTIETALREEAEMDNI
ncbi:Nuclear envelope protein ndc1 [Wickerhamomyces ciferrii]|uniref:Nuclear envelope protein ndc1 n=1 Tax=Wickerhamomyces ciferrii (strain ATCC 14091 / BCRC 22168 / CBS 111 / JCM 3599 / NBRC 0793 / NRRL Y-1031 F-60-10) TaxID=1206466 RepID=K0KLT6_WICCF|nr:Nuclear envelope protein ndc1 [Wickerhamomyces ciferrii]CCH43956.1 Nuclear envelope protein ndc1 [Wickerhamomyces ciferrii]